MKDLSKYLREPIQEKKRGSLYLHVIFTQQIPVVAMGVILSCVASGFYLESLSGDFECNVTLLSKNGTLMISCLTSFDLDINLCHSQ